MNVTTICLYYAHFFIIPSTKTLFDGSFGFDLFYILTSKSLYLVLIEIDILASIHFVGIQPILTFDRIPSVENCLPSRSLVLRFYPKGAVPCITLTFTLLRCASRCAVDLSI